MPYLGLKMPYLDISGLNFENNIVIFEIDASRICLIGNFCAKI